MGTQKDGIDTVFLSKVEEVLRQHFRLLRDFFRHYQTTHQKGSGIGLDSLMRLYQDCKLRSRELAPHHIEVIFNDFREKTSGEQVLLPQGFVAVLVQCAKLKFGETFETLPEQLSQLVEQHLVPNRCHEATS